jgi:hypothetical protein
MVIGWNCTRCGEDLVVFGRVPPEALREPSGWRPTFSKWSAAMRGRNR